MHFSQFNLHPDIHLGIGDAGYIHPTPIQKQTIPLILENKDVLGLAQTGTGKTAAFVLPILQRLISRSSRRAAPRPRALIVAPTRELAEQIFVNIQIMANHTPIKSVAVYGGVGKSPQVKTLRQGVDIIVACPGRLLDLINEKALTLEGIEVMVLDEADLMLDMGFLPDIKRILAQTPDTRQSLVFSATMPKEIQHLAQHILNNPVSVRINPKSAPPRIAHARFNVQKNKRTALLKKLFDQSGMSSTLVFTRTKHKARSLAAQLKKAGLSAASLQGNLSQNQRRKAMNGFRKGSFNILVATDIAARGIDVSGVSHVINYDLPDTVETYIHRTGRTGRADQSGQAYTFASAEDGKMIALIERTLGKKMLDKSLSRS
ncbi:MAG: DEAD/DEAH box helicase [Desulfobacteraceae bacterium]|nr:MAG: DEAD/DEAH box helicase [Desulfobacteraceae bacterium]